MRFLLVTTCFAFSWMGVVFADSVAFLSLDPTASGQIYASWYAQGSHAETLWYNPATLRDTPVSIHASHTYYLRDISYNALSFSYHNYAAGVLYNTDGIMSETWLRGAYTLHVQNFSIASSLTYYAASIQNPERVHADAEASGKGSSISLHCAYRSDVLRAGVTVHNVWGEVTWDSTYYDQEISLSHKEQLERSVSATVVYSIDPFQFAIGTHNDALCASLAYTISTLTFVAGYRDEFPVYSLGVVATTPTLHISCGYILTPYVHYYTAGITFFP